MDCLLEQNFNALKALTDRCLYCPDGAVCMFLLKYIFVCGCLCVSTPTYIEIDDHRF